MEEELTFDQAISKMESILDDLENNPEDSDAAEKIEEAEKLKEYCKNLLKKEKEDIVKMAKENSISLEELGISEEDDFEDDNDDDNEDSETSFNI